MSQAKRHTSKDHSLVLRVTQRSPRRGREIFPLKTPAPTATSFQGYLRMGTKTLMGRIQQMLCDCKGRSV